MRYRAIQEHDRRDPIRLMCRALTGSPAGYYAWAGLPESDRSVHNRDLALVLWTPHTIRWEVSHEWNSTSVYARV